ncbi:MAG TPA: hypothetical protein VK060_16855 [Ruania sp.]|nr:hypothetical protein [Ruania sp.]
MKRSTPTLVLCAAVLAAVAACTATGSDEPASPGSATSEPAAESDPSEDSASESADDPEDDAEAADSEDSDASDSDDDASSADSSSSASRPESSSVTVDLGGDTTVVEPTDVYCSGEPGDIEHIIGKTDNQLPLIEVSGSHFAMVKLDQRGAPEKTQDPQDISYGEDWVTFTDATVGSATLDGSMVCTDWED